MVELPAPVACCVWAPGSVQVLLSCLPPFNQLPKSAPTCCPLPLPPPSPQVYVSYGGLLMQLTGDPKRLEDLDIDQNIYLLMRKV